MKRLCLGVLIVSGLTGCDPGVSRSESPAHGEKAPPARTSIPHAADTGRLTGRIVWNGPIPNLDLIPVRRAEADGHIVEFTRPHPNRPMISGPENGLSQAVVFLRGVSPTPIEPGRFPPVTVVLHDAQPMIVQEPGPPRNVGLVRQGDPVTLVSKQPRFHVLRARGDDFFSFTLSEPDQPRQKTLDRAGLIELSSAARYFWMRGYLWVCEHPWYAVTASDGSWSLEGVPAGTYDLASWHPNWTVTRRERDPESGAVARWELADPFEKVRRVTVERGQATQVPPIDLSPSSR